MPDEKDVYELKMSVVKNDGDEIWTTSYPGMSNVDCVILQAVFSKAGLEAGFQACAATGADPGKLKILAELLGLSNTRK